MITEDYCDFEISKLLKEKGFNEPIRCWYDSAKDFHESGVEMCNSDCVSPTIMCPTHQMAMKWLREVHNLFIFPFPQRNTDSFWVEIYSIDKDKNEDDKWENLYCETIDLKNYSTYEEAVESALKYCLENLI